LVSDANSIPWEFWLGLLERFVEKEGNGRVPVAFVENGHHLGWWAGNQRSFYLKGQLPADRIAQLEAVPGWTWTTFDDKWELGFDSLCRYVEREGHSLMPADYRAPDDYPLGRWVVKQRVACRTGTIEGGRLKRLEAIPEWISDVLSAQWEEGFAPPAPLRRP
jgi:hypothetical protein